MLQHNNNIKIALAATAVISSASAEVASSGVTPTELESLHNAKLSQLVESKAPDSKSEFFNFLSESKLALPGLSVPGNIERAQVDRLSGYVPTMPNLNSSTQFFLNASSATLSPPALVDVNGDGKLDFAYLVRPFPPARTTLDVRINQGERNFETLVSNVVPNGPSKTPYSQVYSFAFADFDNDGKLDTAIAGSLEPDPNIEILKGDGTGRFEHSSFVPGATTETQCIAAGNFTSRTDNNSDIVAAGVDGKWRLYKGDGQGHFTLSSTIDAGSWSTVMLAQDLDNDGDKDFAALSAAGLEIVEGTGSGEFGRHYIFEDPNASLDQYKSLAADFLGGKPVIAATAGDGELPRIWRSENGSIDNFSIEPRTRSTPGITAGVAFGDINGDGFNDLVSTPDRIYGSSTIDVFPGDAQGNLGAREQHSYTNSSAGYLAVGNLDSKGGPEIATTFASVAAIVNNNDYQLNKSIEQEMGLLRGVTTYVHEGALVDQNGDGLKDITIAASPSIFPENPGQIIIKLNNGDGTFASPTFKQLPSFGRNVEFADLNGDSCADIVVSAARTTKLTTYINQKDGTFSEPQSYVGGVEFDAKAVVGDVNNDGRPDIITSSNSWVENPDIHLRFNLGNAVFTSARTAVRASAPVADVSLTDINKDGNPDLVITSIKPDGYNLEVSLGRGDGTFAPTVVNYTGYNFLMVGGVAVDLNGDGMQDLAGKALGEDKLAIAIGDHQGHLKDFQILDAPAFGSNDIIVTDVNLDGYPDLAGINPTVAVSFELGNGSGTFTKSQYFGIASQYSSLVLNGDLNKDGRDDFLLVQVTNYFETPKLFTFINESIPPVQTPHPRPVRPGAPVSFSLDQSVPNPAIEDARIGVALPKAGNISVDIYDPGSRHIKNIIAGEIKSGRHDLVWDLKDKNGDRVAPGLYLCRVNFDGEMATERMVVVR